MKKIVCILILAFSTCIVNAQIYRDRVKNAESNEEKDMLRIFIEPEEEMIKKTEDGGAIAMYELAEWYISHYHSGPKEHDEALKWFKRSAKLGYPKALNKMGVYHSGRNEEEAIKWFRRAAEAGDAWGQNSLGRSYYEGRGIQKDYREAAKWFMRSANQGNAEAQKYLAWCYFNGEGIQKDYNKAVKLINLAVKKQSGYWEDKEFMENYLKAKNGNVKAQYETAKRLEQGPSDPGIAASYGVVSGIKRDTKQAAYWYERAANQGNVDAQYRLAQLYLNGGSYWGGGEDFPKDMKKAAYWMKKAMDNGHQGAKADWSKYDLGKY